MIDLTEFDNRTSSKFIVRDVVDASGDYTTHQYSIHALIEGGDCHGFQ